MDSYSAFMHLDGDKITKLISSNSLTVRQYKDYYTFKRPNLWFAADQNYYYRISGPERFCVERITDSLMCIYVFQSTANWYPLIKIGTKQTPENQVGPEYGINTNILEHLYDPTIMYVRYKPELINEYYLQEAAQEVQFAFQGAVVKQRATDLMYYRCVIDSTLFYIYKFSVDDLPTNFEFDTVTFTIPEVNQIKTSPYMQLANYPAGIRQCVISSLPQKSVNKTYRGRQSLMIEGFLKYLTILKEELGPTLLEITLVNTFDSLGSIALRVDLGRSLEDANLYIKVRQSAPLYATLRYPLNMLAVTQIQPVLASSFQSVTSDDDFESNVIANAGMALAFVGGGLLSGLGQGVGQYAQAKEFRAMQQEKFNFDRGMQQSMFDYQAHQNLLNRVQLERENQKSRNQQSEMQIANFGNQNRMQQQLFRQQNTFQEQQNKFTKELVGTHLDSDIRRARTAQQLAGYRTDAVVSGLDVPRRGGLGHPDQPLGAYLMPRSVSTQTNSPKVNLTRATGNYTGFSISEC